MYVYDRSTWLRFSEGLGEFEDRRVQVFDLTICDLHHNVLANIGTYICEPMSVL